MERKMEERNVHNVYIENFSQSGREDLEDVELSDNIAAIGIGAFYACPNLSRVVLNKNLNYIRIIQIKKYLI